jgi:TolB protein
MKRHLLYRQVLILTGIVSLFVASIAAQDTQPLKNLPGQLAFVGDDYNLYLIQGDATAPQPLTQDGSQSRRYQWPTWSSDGRLAYFCCEMDLRSQSLLLQTYISSDGLEPAKLYYEAENEAFTYASWSPENCDASATCRDLAVLVSQIQQPFKVDIIRDAGERTSQRTVGTGAPFYFSWSHDGDQMLWQRNNRRLSLYNAEDDAVSDLPERLGAFPAPAWSPIDDRALIALRTPGVRAQSSVFLIDLESRERFSLGSGLQGLVAFNWSPNGEYAAYRQVVAEGYGHLYVFDTRTGEQIILSSTAGVIAFLWSPDSTKIAVLSAALSPGNQSAQNERILRLLWSVLDLETGSLQPVYRFAPTAEMAYYLAYFDQFSQSHRLWSPDSRYLVFGENVLDHEDQTGSQLTILDTAGEGTVPFHIKNGLMGIWSFN